MIENKPSIYNSPSIYNQGGGGGETVDYDTDEFVIYSKILFHGAYSFKTFGDNSIEIITVKDDDRLVLSLSTDLNQANKNEYHHVLNFQKIGGSTDFRRCGVVCRATYYNYCIGTSTFGTQINYISNPIDLILDLRKTKVVINGANTTFSPPLVGEYRCNSISAPFGENSFSNFLVFSSDQNLKQCWLPALRRSDLMKGIIDIFSGRFVEAANQTYSELI